MSKKWITTQRDRESAKYKRLHKILADEIFALKNPTPEPSKTERKRAKSAEFRRTAET